MDMEEKRDWPNIWLSLVVCYEGIRPRGTLNRTYDATKGWTVELILDKS